MPRRPSENVSQVALKIPTEWLERFDALADRIDVTAGLTATRTGMIRAAIGLGLEELEGLEKARRPQKRRA